MKLNFENQISGVLYPFDKLYHYHNSGRNSMDPLINSAPPSDAYMY